MRRSSLIAAAVVAGLCTFGITSSPATSTPQAAQTLNPNPVFRYYDMTESASIPPSTESGKQQYLIIGLNPLYQQTITVTRSTQTQSQTGTATTSPASAQVTKSDAASDAMPACSDTKPGHAQVEACKKALKAIDDYLTGAVKQVNATNAATLTQLVQADVESALAAFETPTNVSYITFSNETNLRSASIDYITWLGTVTYDAANTDLAFFTNGSIANAIAYYPQDLTLIQSTISTAANKTDPDVPLMLATIKTDQDFLSKTLEVQTTTQLVQAANTLSNQILQLKKQPSLTYTIVDAPCTGAGFSADTYAVKFTESSTATGTAMPQTWSDTITCYAELNVGAMFFYSGLGTQTYTLKSAMQGGMTVNVATSVSNNRDQGSVAGVLNYCFQATPQSWCGAAALTSGTNGLTGLVGAGYLFANRNIGAYAGVRISQVTQLQPAYANGQAVPSGATYTFQQTQPSWFVGLSLNIPSASK